MNYGQTRPKCNFMTKLQKVMCSTFLYGFYYDLGNQKWLAKPEDHFSEIYYAFLHMKRRGAEYVQRTSKAE